MYSLIPEFIVSAWLTWRYVAQAELPQNAAHIRILNHRRLSALVPCGAMICSTSIPLHHIIIKKVSSAPGTIFNNTQSPCRHHSNYRIRCSMSWRPPSSSLPRVHGYCSTNETRGAAANYGCIHVHSICPAHEPKDAESKICTTTLGPINGTWLGRWGAPPRPARVRTILEVFPPEQDLLKGGPLS